MKKQAIIFTSIIGSIIFIFALLSFKGADKKVDYGNGYILIEVYEIPDYTDAGVHIHFGSLKSEFIPFKSFKDRGNHDDNADIILQSVNRFAEEGYKIESTCSGMTAAGMITKIFLRKQ